MQQTKPLSPVIGKVNYLQNGPGSIPPTKEIAILAQLLSKDELNGITNKQLKIVREEFAILLHHINTGTVSNQEIITQWMSFYRSIVFKMYRLTIKVILNSNDNPNLTPRYIKKSNYRTKNTVLDEIAHLMDDLPQ